MLFLLSRNIREFSAVCFCSRIDARLSTEDVNKMGSDMIYGHEFLGVPLDVLLHRMKDLGFKRWSCWPV